MATRVKTKTWVEPYAKDVWVRGFKMHYYEWPGDGPTVIFLHPSSGFGRMWDWVVKDLLGEFHILALDQRCHGDSGRPPGPHSGEAYAEDLHAFITRLGLGRVHLIGHSLGGRAVQVYAALHPEHTATITCSGGPHYISFFRDPAHEQERAGGVVQMAERVNVFPTREAAADNLRQSPSGYAEETVQHLIKYNVRDNPDGTVSFKYDPTAVAEGLSHIPDKLTKYTEKVTCPVLFLRGKQSTTLTRKQAEEIAALYKDCTIWEVDGQYSLQVENPAEAAAAYRRFILAHA